MLLLFIITILTSVSLTLRADKSILYSRIGLSSLYLGCFLVYSGYTFMKETSLVNGLLYVSTTTSLFHFFLFILSFFILALTSFYSRKIVSYVTTSFFKLLFFSFIYKASILNKNNEMFRIIEYSLLLLFVLLGSLFLLTCNDMVTMFISLELQSYGLYIICSVYRNSESSTGGGLMYFLLGGLSSCFILLGTAILYSNSATTNFDNIYIINNISTYSLVLDSSIVY
jgi:NADH-ubiquinone oxidoreductase chain 2